MSDIEETELLEGGAEENSQGGGSQELSGDQMPDGESSGPQSDGASMRSGERIEAGIGDMDESIVEGGEEMNNTEIVWCFGFTAWFT